MTDQPKRPRGRPPSTDPWRNVTLRLRDSDIERLRSCAVLLGMTQSAYLRALIFGELGEK